MAISLIGVYMVNWRHDKSGFLFHTVSALCWVWYDWGLGAHEQAVMILGSAGTSIAGYIKWWYDERGKR